MSQWFTAVLAMQCRINGVPDGATDLQFRVLHADDHEDAYARALALGANAVESYLNASGENVTWTFAGLFDLDLIDAASIGDGTEVFSLRSEKPIANLVKEKSSLAAFWLEANKHRTVRELLGGNDA